MPGSITALACLFWSVLLSVVSYSIWRLGAHHPYQYYLIGIPLGMIALTIVVGEFVERLRHPIVALLAATALSLLAALLWWSLWNAAV